MQRRIARVALGSSAAALLLAACSGGGSAPNTSTGSAQLSQSLQVKQASASGRILNTVTGRMGLPAKFSSLPVGVRETSPGWMSEDAKKAAPKAFVSDYAANAVYIYNATKPASPIGTITTGLSSPLGSTVDAAGNFYVANLGSSTVTVYGPGKTTPSKTYSSGLSSPIGVAIGKDGTLYVSEFSAGAVVEYAKGKTTPIRTLTVSEAEGVALDSKNNLYVSYINASTGEGAVEKFAPKATTGKDLGITVGFAGDVRLDKKNDVLLGDQDAQTINFYKPGATTSYGSIAVGGDAYKFAFNSTETTIFDADTTNVPYFAAKPSGTLEGTISTGLQSAYGISLSPTAPADE